MKSRLIPRDDYGGARMTTKPQQNSGTTMKTTSSRQTT
ncbi:hypothetical protein O3G_MSEX000193 [Manduca sexta]|nr:hypothetical protein O3G_MSEX000193 [Manduca sexta]